MLISETVDIKWTPSNKKHYESFGYKWTKQGDYFTVNVYELSKGSHAIVDVTCDFCGKYIPKKYKTYLRDTKNETTPCSCHDCKENKTKVTNLEKYGVEYVISSEKIKAKIESTNLERYGTKYAIATPKIREKIRQTNLMRYGVEYTLQVPEIRQRIVKSMYENGTTPTSSQQAYIHSLIGGELNYPFKRSSLDIAFLDTKIYVEYDGGGHALDVKLGHMSRDEFNKKEQRRSFFLKDNGWREIRIISDKDKLPSDKTILDFVEITKSFIIADKWFSAHWNIDENFVKVNYKHIYSLEEFFEKFNNKEAIS